MLQFKKGNFINEQKLNYAEAVEFIVFLESEIRRHKRHLEEYMKIAEDEDTSDFLRIVAQTVVIRNLDDIRHTQKTIDYLDWRYDGFKK